MLPGRGVLLGLALAALVAVPGAAARKPKKLPVLNVVPVAAQGATTQTIGESGGSLSVTTPNGTRATLEIPAQALSRDTQITMTPLAAVKKLPLKKGLVAAVQLAPEGLTFARPATLTFAPRKAVPMKLRTPFAAGGSGHSFHLYPASKSKLTLPLFHFSMYGEGEASASQRSAEAHRRQSDPQSQSERDLAQARSDEAVALAALPVLTRVAAEVKAAASDETRAIDVLDDALSVAEELRLYDFSSEVLPPYMGDQIPKSVDPILRARLQRVIRQIRAYFPQKILDNALARLEQRCAAEHQPALADGILTVEEYRSLFGLTDEVDLGPFERCLTFELDVDTEFHTTGLRLDLEVHARSKVPLRPAFGATTWSGNAPIEYLSYAAPYDCPYTWSGSGTWYVLGLKLTQGKLDRQFHVLEPVRVLSLSTSGPAAQEQLEVRCPGSDPVETESVYLDQAWQAGHQDEGSGLFTILGWRDGSGDVVGTKNYARSFSSAGLDWTESTTLTVRHTPQT